LLLATLFGQFPFLETLFADSAYQGPIFANALAGSAPIAPNMQPTESSNTRFARAITSAGNSS
jgi:hypothetical protein